jgi:hypothetical protein
MFSPGEIVQQSLRYRGETGKPARKKGTFRAFRAFRALFFGIGDQVEAYTATAQFGSSLIRITSMLIHPLPRIPRLPRILSGQLNRRSLDPARFTDLVRLVSLSSLSSHISTPGPTRGEDCRCRLAPPEPAAVTDCAYTSSSALFFAFFPSQGLESRRCLPLRRLGRIRRTLSPAHYYRGPGDDHELGSRPEERPPMQKARCSNK